MENSTTSSDTTQISPITLSPSKASTFTQCGRRYRFRYIDHLPDPPTEATVLGTTVHRALELFYQRSPEQRGGTSLDTAFVQATRECDERGDFGLLDQVAAWEIALQIFVLENPSAVDVVSTELQVDDIVGGFPLRGIIDRVDREPDGTISLVDYKTGKVPSKRDESDKLRALMLYSRLWGETHEEKVERVKLVYLRGTPKRRVPIVVSAEVDDEGVAFAEKRLAAIGAAIELARSNDYFGPNAGPLCGWCPYRDRCPEGDSYLLLRGK